MGDDQDPLTGAGSLLHDVLENDGASRMECQQRFSAVEIVMQVAAVQLQARLRVCLPDLLAAESLHCAEMPLPQSRFPVGRGD